MTTSELKKELDANANLIILDVREQFELDICKLPFAKHIPMSEVPNNLPSIPSDKEVVVMCHHGVRSMRIVNYLKENGFNKVQNLDGGIHDWALKVDPQMSTY